MDDLISRKALYDRAVTLEAEALEALKKFDERNGDNSINVNWAIWQAILTERTAFKHDIFDAPSTEPKKGHWIKMSDADGVYWTCEECGINMPRFSRYNPQFDLFPQLESIEKTNYCPSCGAKMENQQ